MLEAKRINQKSEYFDKAFELYESAFPFIERRAKEAHLAAMSDSEFSVMALFFDGEFCGILQYWDTAEFVYLEHFAIAQNMRGHGLGKLALDYLKSLNKTVILEIEPPRVSDYASRRKNFYERNGFVYHDIPHVQAHYHALDEDCILNIMATRKLDERDYKNFKRYIDEKIEKLAR